MKKFHSKKIGIANHGFRLGLFLGYISIFILSLIMEFSMNHTSAADLLETIFQPAKSQETIINLGNTSDAVGNEVFREGVGVQAGLGCFVAGQKISKSEIEKQKSDLGSNLGNKEFCEQILGGEQNVLALTTQAPLIVRITKFLLRITMVLSVTMVIFNGVMYITEAAKGGDVKSATKNLGYVALGILLALMSLGIINLINSVTISTFK